ncbi:TIGR03668 family PPOX class F420-dependent oxidoreductase [Streptomyces sp. TRM S81-3]|uniref:TIGR03668 family PPOX class F420-dependent oxidoreductase n=1 Tax=Streptomyces griseicoloratus TaxID=2752516 RepID=A0A926QTU3_9ACTN|nr:TIGR03668 family PPOX class F420-dependent oxidoreductase [Streptomyces griseicoloratus]MBD0422437.1 TIGR03668 family PPOX class F420-dependent oxidoreductase [Streptomyces griseicoloratus]
MPEMGRDEARRRFGAARVARLATVDPAGRPQLVPVVFARDGDAVVTAVDHKPKRSQRLGRLRNIAAHPAVSLLVDLYDEDWDRLWWVRADGDARVLPPDDAPAQPEYAAAMELLRSKYPQYRQRPPEGPVIAVGVLRWTGWRAVQEDDGDRETTGPGLVDGSQDPDRL